MASITEVQFGQDYYFSVTTHDPDTGDPIDVDVGPSYRIYDGLNDTPVKTGVMAKVDDDNTIGFYAVSVTCTAANGFAVGHNYSVYIYAEVGDTEDTISYGFRITAQAGIGEGANVVTITVRAGSPASPGAVVPDVKVRIWRSGTLMDFGRSNADGQVILALDDGAYGVYLQKLAEYTFTQPEPLTVSGTTSVTYYGTAFMPSDPGDPSLCNVYGWVLDTSGQPIEGATVTFTYKGVGRVSGPKVVLASQVSVTTDATGYFSAALIRSASYAAGRSNYSMTVNEWSRTFQVPNQAAYNVGNIITGVTG